MTIELGWMPVAGPYMPVATAGLLSALEQAERPATAQWREKAGRRCLEIDTDLDSDDLAVVLAETAWPSPTRIPWPPGVATASAQAIKPLLEKQDEPGDAFRAMVAAAPPAEARFLGALLTDGVLDGKGVPSRSRLLRGVKADLSGVANRPKSITAAVLATELAAGPEFRRGKSGLGLGLVPEVQTFGGSTGPPADQVGAYSPLLYILLWLGVMALPPVPVSRGPRRTVGGPLVTAADVISWPVWTIPVDIRSLRVLFCLDAIHVERPDAVRLAQRGIAEVYRARAVELSTMVAVYRWGQQVAR